MHEADVRRARHGATIEEFRKRWIAKASKAEDGRWARSGAGFTRPNPT